MEDSRYNKIYGNLTSWGTQKTKGKDATGSSCLLYQNTHSSRPFDCMKVVRETGILVEKDAKKHSWFLIAPNNLVMLR